MDTSIEFKGTKRPWEIRFMNSNGTNKNNGSCDFFIEAKEPKNHIGKIEIMMEDFGQQNGYRREQKLADARLIENAPNLLVALENAVVGLEWKLERQPTLFDKADHENLYEWRELIKKTLTL